MNINVYLIMITGIVIVVLAALLVSLLKQGHVEKAEARGPFGFVFIIQGFRKNKDKK